ncbi:helix-turn-helix domain-containing protein, partial [Streptomyces sp. JJ36]|uniref:helix-turn-helix domain-containing protein n=1 Tax=Streptomyces sp. JJ36 TaxID=2736645 RepID=UPI001F490814
MSDNELGRYLRARREAVTPADVGLPPGTRRRTPGLRRAELATLAGVSVEYLTRLEQGRDRHPSAQVLGALADALRLPSAERVRLRQVAKAVGGHPGPCPAAEPPARAVRPTVRALLERLEPTPAVLLNRLSEVLAHTTGYARLVAPLGVLDVPDGAAPGPAGGAPVPQPTPPGGRAR